MISKRHNVTIANIQVLLSTLVVLIHGGSIFINLPGKSLQYVYGYNYSTFIQLFICEGVTRIAVPLFFVLSGYLFYKSFDGTLEQYYNKMKRRIRSLVIPYLFWSSFVFFLFFAAQKILGMGEYFTTRNEDGLSLKVIVDNVIISSYDSPLWFCRYLIVFSVFSIGLYWLYRKLAIPTLLSLFLGWFFSYSFGIGIRMDALFFYSVGAVIALFPTEFERVYLRVRKLSGLLAIAWFATLIVHTELLCRKDPSYLLQGEYDVWIETIGKTGIILGSFVFWNWFNSLKNEHEWNIATYSFLIFAIHHPVVNTLKKLFMKVFGVSTLSSLLTFILASICTIGLIILFGYLMRRFLPRTYSVITGGR